MNDLYFTAKNKKPEICTFGDDIRLTAMIYSSKGADDMHRTLCGDDIRMYISPQASYTFNDIPSLRLG